MKVLQLILVVIICLLSIAAGAAKVLQSPEEVQFLQGFGFNTTLIISYGLIQVAGGVLLAISKTRKLGALVTIVGFAISTILIGMAGNLGFAAISLLPILVISFIFWQASRMTKEQ